MSNIFNDRFAKEATYWSGRLGENMEITKFPSDFKRKNPQQNITSICNGTFSSQINEKLITMSSKSDFALYMILLTGVRFVLEQYTEMSDTTVIMPVFKQNKGTGALINYILPLRTITTDLRNFKELLLETRKVVTEANANQNYPVMNHLKLQVGENSAPVLNTVAMLDSIHDKEYLGDMSTDILINFSRKPESIDAAIEYNSLVYEEETIKKLFDHISKYFEIVMNNPSISLNDIVVMTPEESEKIRKKVAKSSQQGNVHGLALQKEYVENKLISILKQQLGNSEIGLDDNFFYDLGGNSLIGISFLSQVSKELNIELPLSEIFINPTVRSMASCISNAADNTSNAGISDEKVEGSGSSSDHQDVNINQNNAKEINDEITTVAEDEFTTYDNSQYFWHSSFTNVELKVTLQKDITSHTCYAYPLSAILAFSKFNNWYYQHFIQLYAKECIDGSIMLDYQEPEDFYIDIMDCQSVSNRQLYNMDNIVLFIIRNLENGFYVNISMGDALNDLLIYGYDMLGQRFLAMESNDGYETKLINIEYERIKNAFKKFADQYGNNGLLNEKIVLKLFAARDIKRSLFDISRFFSEINGYLSSKGSYERVCTETFYDGSTNGNDERLVFGIDALKILLENLKKATCKRMPVDERTMRLLTEHKKGMLKRLEYASKYCGESEVTLYMEQYKEVVAEFEEIFKLYLKVKNDADSEGERDLSELTGAVKLAVEKEKEILLNICKAYNKGNIANVQPIVKKDSYEICENGSFKRKELKIKLQRQVTSYLNRAYPLCIIMCHDYIAWLNAHLVQICAQVFADGYAILDYQEECYFYNEIMDFYYMGYKQLEGIENIVDHIIEKLNAGSYINICLDGYYLNTKNCYMKEHFVHENLVYGYDNASKRFSIMGFGSNGVFNTYYVAYETLHKAFEDGKIHYKDSAPYAELSAFICYTPRNHQGYIEHEYYYLNEINRYIETFLNELDSYLTSNGSNTRVSIIFPPNADNIKKEDVQEDNIKQDSIDLKYGIEAVMVALDRFKKLAQGKILIDYRAIHLLAEHKRGILDRLEFMAKYRDEEGRTRNLIERYKEVVNDFEFIRIKSFEIVSTQDDTINNNNIMEIVKTMETSVNKELDILTQIYEYYRG